MRGGGFPRGIQGIRAEGITPGLIQVPLPLGAGNGTLHGTLTCTMEALCPV